MNQQGNFTREFVTKFVAVIIVVHGHVGATFCLIVALLLVPLFKEVGHHGEFLPRVYNAKLRES